MFYPVGGALVSWEDFDDIADIQAQLHSATSAASDAAATSLIGVVGFPNTLPSPASAASQVGIFASSSFYLL